MKGYPQTGSLNSSKLPSDSSFIFWRFRRCPSACEGVGSKRSRIRVFKTSTSPEFAEVCLESLSSSFSYEKILSRETAIVDCGRKWGFAKRGIIQVLLSWFVCLQSFLFPRLAMQTEGPLKSSLKKDQWPKSGSARETISPASATIGLPGASSSSKIGKASKKSADRQPSSKTTKVQEKEKKDKKVISRITREL